MTPKILVLPGSLRTGSYNARLAALAVKELALRDAEVTRISLADYDLPVYNADIETERGVPEPAVTLARLFAAQDGILIVAPEYNAGVAPLTKNAIDWISRVREPELAPFKDRVFALAAASPGRFGGIRGLMMLRQSLELGLGALVVPEMFSLSNARSAFDETDGFADPAQAKRLSAMIEAFLARVRQFGAWTR